MLRAEHVNVLHACAEGEMIAQSLLRSESVPVEALSALARFFGEHVREGHGRKERELLFPIIEGKYGPEVLRLNLRGVEKGPNEKSIEDILLDAGCKLGPSGCGACLGGPVDTFGRLNAQEICISTTNRNFPGRMGSTKSAVYLASPLTVAASALTGHVTDPRDFVSTRIETGLAGVT